MLVAIGFAALPRTGQAQQSRRRPPRDSAVALDRVVVVSSPDVVWPDHGRYQSARQASRDSLLRQLAAARERWRQQGALRVSFRVQMLCFCMRTDELPVYTTVEAVGDVVLSVVDQRGQAASALKPADGRPSVPFLFTSAEAAIRGTADLIIVTFDPVLGIPTRILVDDQVGTTDDELDIIVFLPPRHLF